MNFCMDEAMKGFTAKLTILSFTWMTENDHPLVRYDENQIPPSPFPLLLELECCLFHGLWSRATFWECDTSFLLNQIESIHDAA